MALLVTAWACAFAVNPFAQNVATNIGYGAPKADGSRGVALEPDQTKELAMKILEPFTVVAVGDLLEFQPFARNMAPDIQYFVNLLRNADLTVGDLENEMKDFDNFGHFGGNLGTKEVADDFALMGIDMVSRANNKQTDGPSVWSDFQQVERVGIVHAGVARTLPEARMARYLSTAKGLVGFVGYNSDGGTGSCCTGGTVVRVSPEQLAQVKAMKAAILARRDEVEVPIAMPPPDPANEANVFNVTFVSGDGPLPARPPAGGRGAGAGGQAGFNWVKNAVRVTQFNGVTAEQMKQLRAIAGDKGKGSDLHAFGTQFRLMDRPGEYSYDMNADDVREIMTQVRTGKQASDFLASNFHWHQNRYAFQQYSHDHFPADFEIKFAHMAIDHGVDMFAAQGVHTIKGVEIYKGKPIFYGLSNFVFQSGLSPRGKGQLFASPHGMPGGPAPAGAPGPAIEGGRGGGRGGGNAATPASVDAIVGEHEFGVNWQLKANLEALVAESRYENGKLAEVRVHPVDLGQTWRPMSQVGIPKKPTPAVVKKILDQLIEYSKPFGTKFVIEDGVAVIRIPPSERQ